MRIAITRSSAQLRHLELKAALRSIEVVSLPLLEVRHHNFDWPGDVDLTKLGWVFFTSANGVDAFLHRLDSVSCKLPRQTKIAVVGGKTKAALENRGFEASFIPSEPYGRLLFGEFIDRYDVRGSALVYARAAEVDFDPESLFRSRKLIYRGIICYSTCEAAVEPQIVSKLKQDDYILFTAPSAVRAYYRQFGDPETRILAIGNTTALEMQKHRWANFTVLEDADVDSVLEYV